MSRSAGAHHIACCAIASQLHVEGGRPPKSGETARVLLPVDFVADRGGCNSDSHRVSGFGDGLRDAADRAQHGPQPFNGRGAESTDLQLGVRVFGAATDCRHLSFAGPRPSGKVRSFAPKNDRLATERRSATPRWPRRVSFFLFFSKIQPTFIYPAPSYGRANAPTCAFPDRLCWVVPCRGAHALWCKHRLQCHSSAGFCAGLR